MFGSGQVRPTVGPSIIPHNSAGAALQAADDGTGAQTDPNPDEATLAALAAEEDKGGIVTLEAVARGHSIPLTSHIHTDARGHLRYAVSDRAEALAEFKRETGGKVRDLGRGIFVRRSRLGVPEVLQLDISPNGTMVDIADLTATVANAKPILFFKPLDKKREAVFGPFEQWMDVLRALGYDIRLATNEKAFAEELGSKGPFDIVCFSGTEMDWKKIAEGFRTVKKLSPNSVTLIGGLAARKEVADSFDIVAPSDDSFAGEGDILLPMILRRLQELIASGPVRRELPVLFEKKFPEFATASLPNDTRKFTQSAYWTPPLTRETADAVARASAMRFIGKDGDTPSHEVALVAGAEIFIRSENGIIPPSATEKTPLLDRPTPVNETEIDILSSQQSKAVFDRPPSEVGLYVQRGCRGKARCAYCSIANPPGRRNSVDNVIERLRSFAKNGVIHVIFFDDNFVANKAWIKELLNKIEAEKLHEHILFRAQVRADMNDYELLNQLLRLGFYLYVGMETLDPKQAEKIGKVAQGKGEEYVQRARQFFAEAGKFAQENPAMTVEIEAYAIWWLPGDSTVAMVREIRRNLELLKELLERYNFALQIKPNIMLLPGFSDLITWRFAYQLKTPPGLNRIEFGSIDSPLSDWRAKGGVAGLWHAFGFEPSSANGPVQSGVFGPVFYMLNNFMRGFDSEFRKKYPDDPNDDKQSVRIAGLAVFGAAGLLFTKANQARQSIKEPALQVEFDEEIAKIERLVTADDFFEKMRSHYTEDFYKKAKRGLLAHSRSLLATLVSVHADLKSAGGGSDVLSADIEASKIQLLAHITYLANHDATPQSLAKTAEAIHRIEDAIWRIRRQFQRLGNSAVP